MFTEQELVDDLMEILLRYELTKESIVLAYKMFFAACVLCILRLFHSISASNLTASNLTQKAKQYTENLIAKLKNSNQNYRLFWVSLVGL